MVSKIWFFFYQNHWLFYTFSAFERLNAINLQREKSVFNAFNVFLDFNFKVNKERLNLMARNDLNLDYFIYDSELL